MFNIGQNIVYPMHGAGVVEAIETKVVDGKPSDYYKVRIITGNINLMVPVDNVSGVRMREVIDPSRAAEMIMRFDSFRSESNVPWNKRYKTNVDRLKSGDIEDVAGVLADLISREKTHGLSTSDRKMFILARNIFCSEFSVALGIPCDQIFDTIMQNF